MQLSIRLCEHFNIIPAKNYHISTTIRRRQQATALPRCHLLRKRWTNRFESCRKSKQKNNRHKTVSEELITTRNRVVAKQSRREGVYNRTGDLSVICFGEEEQRNECEAIKNRRKRYVACDDVAGVAESDKASLVACNNLYVPFASQKMD